MLTLHRTWTRAWITGAAALIVLLSATTAAEADLTLSVSGDTLTVTGTPGPDRFSITDEGNGRSRIQGDDVLDPLPALCERGPDYGYVYCVNSGPRPLMRLVVNLGGGDDTAGMAECYTSGSVNLGDGANEATLPDNCDGPFTYAGGSGPDKLTVDSSSMPFTADLGAGDDQVYGGGSSVVHGGPGADELNGTDGRDELYGGDGADSIVGQAGDDLIYGGDGDDLLGYTANWPSPPPEPGADDIRGGPGNDEFRTGDDGGVSLSLNDIADDGATGEGDNLHSDIEIVYGGEGNDTITGGPGRDAISGRGGIDTLAGGPAADAVVGGPERDTVSGGPGNDRLEGGSGDDRVDGGPGLDSLYGDTETCALPTCPSGNDTLLARDGEKDAIQCGPGADSAQVDFIDVVATDGLALCESVDRAPEQQQVPCCAPPQQSIVFGSSVIGKASVKRGLRVRITCPAACRFSATVVAGRKVARRYKLGRGKVTIASARGRLAQAGSRVVTLRLTTKARRRLARVRKATVTLRTRATYSTGKPTTNSRLIVLRP